MSGKECDPCILIADGYGICDIVSCTELIYIILVRILSVYCNGDFLYDLTFIV